MCSRLLLYTVVRRPGLQLLYCTGREISARPQLLSSELDTKMSYRGGGYGRRGRGPNRGGGRASRGPGVRVRGGGSGRGAGGKERGDRAEGHGAPPPGLRGRELGMWYASRSRAQKKKRELSERAVVSMSREAERNISRILKDVRRHSDTSQTSFTSSDSFSSTGETRFTSSEALACSSSGASLSKSAKGPFLNSDSDTQWRTKVQKEEEENYIGMESEPLRTGETGLTGNTGLSSASGVDYPDSGGAGGSGDAKQLFYIDNDGEGWDTIEEEVKRETEEVEKLAKDLKSELEEKKERNSQYKKMMEFRRKLPSWKTKEHVLKMVAENQVCVISGETGCGKTTQVPQFILDEALLEGHGSKCHVICTQPRRISAISVAERVASERGERLGKSVGFQIRLENTLPRPHGSITYCTTGILLRRLIGDPLLSDVSHVIMDEVHERSIQSDFLQIIIRDLLPKRPDLKLILMSATLNAEMFSEYFNKAPMFTIPNVVFPVAEYFLEDILKFTRFKPQVKLARPRSHRSRFGEGRVAYEKEQEEGSLREDYINSLEMTKTYPSHVIEALRCYDYKEINLELIKALLRYICSMGEGAILVFLPGWDTISKMNDLLQSDPVFRSRQKYLIIPLHSMMPTAYQQQVFDRPPEGVRKIIIATNIAETSITIDDVVFVVDCGKVKETTYDAANQLACLEAVWVSKAAARQRRGRAGRVQAGHCFHLFTKHQLEQLAEYQQPEMLRTPLEELVLQIKILKLGEAGAFLQKAIQAPEKEAVSNAIRCLKDLNALTGDEELTPLGFHLANLPVNPRIGKIILFAAMFSCLDPVLTIASSLGFKEPFVIPLNKQEEADEVKKRFAGDSRSDHIALLRAYQGWEEARYHGNSKQYCWDNFLSNNTLELLRNMKGQFTGLLYETGFIPSSDPKHSSANFNSENMKLVKAVLCSGLYPNVLKLVQTRQGRLPKLYTKNSKVKFHPKSINSEETDFENKFMIYYTLVKSSSAFVHDCSMIPPFPLLFFGGDISVLQEEGQEVIAVDEWIKFQAPRKIAELVKELRHQMDAILKQKIATPSMDLYNPQNGSLSPTSQLIEAIIDLITTEDYSQQSARLAAGKHLYSRRK